MARLRDSWCTSLPVAQQPRKPQPESIARTPYQTWRTALDSRILRMIATVIEVCDPPREGGRGHPPADTIRVLATLRRFLREGTPWRSLTATAAQASGSTLRRWLTRWAE